MALFSKTRLVKLIHKKSKKPKQNDPETGKAEDTILPQTLTAVAPTSSGADAAHDVHDPSTVSIQTPSIDSVPQQAAHNDVPKETLFPWKPSCELEALIQHNSTKTPPSLCLMIASHLPFFYDDNVDLRVINQKVVLERCLHGHNTLISGVIRVHNTCYHKNVFARISQDNWNTFEDTKAEYIDSDGTSDRFEFGYDITTNDVIGNDFQLAVCYQSETGEFWDNNDDKNYVLQFKQDHLQSLTVCVHHAVTNSQ